jgi:hypothetical protein
MAGFKVGADQVAAAAWVYFVGTGTAAVLDSYNVSGFTDGGTGIYTINWDASFTNANYAWVSMAHYGSGQNDIADLQLFDSGDSDGSLKVQCLAALNSASTSSAADAANAAIVAFGN